MNVYSEEMRAIMEESDEFIAHEGRDKEHTEVPGGPGSGRYPRGSGERPNQHGYKDILERVDSLKAKGWTETPENIMNEFGLSTGDYRSFKSIAYNERKDKETALMRKMRDEGMSSAEIARRMNVPVSTVKSRFVAEEKSTKTKAAQTADILRKAVDEKGVIEVGKGVERELGVASTRLKAAIDILRNEGYELYGGRVEQSSNQGYKTTVTVLCPPGTPKSAAYDYRNINSLMEYTPVEGNTETTRKFQYPESLDGKRMMVRFADQGGLERDGTIEIRRGVPDLSLGKDRYSQVRILVNGTHYLKGMAVYGDDNDFPPGVDVIFNTNKTQNVPVFGDKTSSVLKPIKKDPRDPFGALIKPNGQSDWYDEKGEKHLSLINKRAEEGDWGEWSNAVPSQFLSKQNKSLIQQQLNISLSEKMAQFDEIKNISNPTLKKYMLNKFALECDSASVDLKAAALPGQKYHVIVPINTLKDTECFAPNYPDGTKLALVRYPHGGTFEIPVVTVNNKNELGIRRIGKDSIDGIGITKNVADRLSGADFDGDTVMAIPTDAPGGRIKITRSNPLKGLEGFDPKDRYSFDEVKVDPKDPTKVHYYREGKEYAIMKDTQKQMGVVSNLITDMTLLNATEDEKARAVRHSMVVIDAEKHHLDWKASALENDIQGLIRKYQVHYNEDGTIKYGGAATLLSKAKGQASVVQRQGAPRINEPGKPWYDPNRPDGSLIYKESPLAIYSKTKIGKDGIPRTTTAVRTQISTQMAEADDARDLISPMRSDVEVIYADYANTLKKMARDARLAMTSTPNLKRDPQAVVEYETEVRSLMNKLNEAELNRPRERAAQIRTAAYMQDITEGMTWKQRKAARKELSKKASKILREQRNEVGSVSRKSRNIDITDREWEAIQKGAISEAKLKSIFENTDVDALRQRVSPRVKPTMTPAKQTKAVSMLASGKTIEQIASALGVSNSTVYYYLKEGEA